MSNEQEIVEDAIAKRLARLSGMPVDSSHLEARLKAALPAEATGGNRHAGRRRGSRAGWITGVAASALIAATVGWLTLGTGGETAVAAADLARVHREVVEGKGVAPVTSVDEANRMIAAMAEGLVTVPGVPAAHVHACCMKSVKDKKVACVLLKNEGEEPVTMTVAPADAMKSPRSPTVAVGGVTYHVEKVGDLTMVMTERHGRWVCLVSKAEQGKLIELAGKLIF